MKNPALSRRSFVGVAGALALTGLVGCSSSHDEASTEGSNGASSEPSSAPSTPSSSAAPSTEAASASTGKSIIVLWSWSGNTLKMAERISELSGADIYRIEAADPYPDTDHYDDCVDRAKQEQDDGVYPEIANPIENWDDYDTVYLGYPIWWYELPMIVQGFVNDHDWTGKTIVPFNSHEGSGDSGTYDDLREMTGATVLEGLAIRGGSVATSLESVDDWYTSL